MLNREEIEQLIDQKIEPLTEEIAALKAQLSKVDLLAVDNRNIRQSLRRIESSQESLKLDFERQEKRIAHFERQTNEQFININNRLTNVQADTDTLKERVTGVQADTAILKEQVTGVQADTAILKEQVTNVQADTAILKEQMALVVTMLRRVLPPEERR
jgi:chromosome segregation ATPase